MKWIHNVRNFGKIGTPLEVSARIARLLLVAFVLTFLAARIVVFLIAERAVPNLFLFVGATHVHHLNYGISLLSLVGLLLLMFRPTGVGLYLITIGYGIGLGLTFDEFGMWLTLGGSYNNRLTFDAIVVIATLLGSVALLTTVEEFHPRHWVVAAVVAALLLCLVGLAVLASHHPGVMERVFSIQGL